MSSRRCRQRQPAELQVAVTSYQDAHVIHRCAVCAKPCCRLDSHVLELNWKQVKVFWRLEESRAAFDRRLSSGKGPEEIRAGDGLYYIHRKACPAYDETRRSCRVYDQALKPAGCTDYPVYEDGDFVIADLRCEAVDIDILAAWIARALGPEFRIVQSADKDFPFLVSLAVRRLGTKPESRGRRSGPG
jgi:Fe-S-cluster containining protein